MEVLTTKRLRLRAPRLDDAGWIAIEIARPDVQRMLTSPPHPYRLQHAEAWLARQGADCGSFVIEAEAPLGLITLRYDEDNVGDLGYWLCQNAWGRGYVTEAARAVVDCHFQTRCTTLRSGHITDNPASRNVLCKLGFRDTHVEQTLCHFRGAEVPVQRMELTAADWAANSPSAECP